MTATETTPASEAPAPAFPDYMTDPNAVLKDIDASWRYGKPPDYTNTRRVFAESKTDIFDCIYTGNVLNIPSSQEMQPRTKLPRASCREPGQKLGNRSVVQDLSRRLANCRPEHLYFRDQWRASSVSRAYEGSRDVQRHHRSERVL